MKRERAPVVSIGEAAEIIGVHVTTLRRMADEGVIESTRTPGGHRRFRLSEIARFVPDRAMQMAVYVQYGQQGEIHRIVELLEELGHTPKMSIEERSADMTRPLYRRPGIIRMCEYAGRGFIQGFVAPEKSHVGGWDQVGVLGIMNKLGLKCFIAREESIEMFPPI